MAGTCSESLLPGAANRWRNVLFLGAIVFGGGLRLYWSVLLPFNDAPDEAWHYPMVVYLRTEYRLPTMADVPGRIPNSYPALPPVGYSACVLMSLLRPANDPNFLLWARLGNVVVGILTIWVGFLATREMIPARPAIALASAWAMAVHPQLVFLNAYVNPDSLMVLGSTLLWYSWVRIARTGLSIRHAILFGLTAGVTLLAKPNSLGVVLAGLPIVIVQIWNVWPAWQRTVFRYVLAGTVGLLVCIPWILWSWHHHHSLFGIEVHRTWWKTFVDQVQLQTGVLRTDNLGDFCVKTWKSFWASFGYCTVWLEPYFYLLITGMTGLAAGVLAVRGPELHRWFGWQNRASFGSVITSMLLGTLLVVSTLVVFAARFWLSPQGRYLLPVIWVAVTLLLVGHALLGTGRWPGRLGIGAVLGLLGWMQFSAIEAEKQSNRYRQADRRVGTELLAYETSLPGPPDNKFPELRPIGSARITPIGGLYRLHCRQAGDGIVLFSSVRADRLAWVVIEQRLEADRSREPILEEGSIELRTPDRPGQATGTIRFQYPGRGVYRYRFDVRKLAESLGSTRVGVVLRPTRSQGTVLLRRLELLGHDHQVLVGSD